MEIKEHRLQLFIEMYQKQFGTVLTRDEAYEKALQLIHYTRLFIRPLAKEKESDINSMSNINQ